MKNEVNTENVHYLASRLESTIPALYRVFVHNDDFTPMEFVIGVLEKFFYVSRIKATEIMMEAHLIGKSVCGEFTKDVAETKLEEINKHTQTNEHPLLFSMERT